MFPAGLRHSIILNNSMLKQLTHVGIAVRNLEEAMGTFSKLFQNEAGGTETVPDQKVNLAFFHVGGASIELTEATSPESPIAKFIEKRSERGPHLSFEVEDIKSENTRSQVEGFQIIDDS